MLEKFKDLSSFFKKENVIDNKKKEISEKINYYINEDMLDLVMEYRLNGYLLTASQSKKFHKKYDKVAKDKKVEFLYNALLNKRTVSDQIILEFFYSFADNYQCYKENSARSITYKYEIREDTKLILEEYQKRCENKDFVLKLQSYLIDKIENIINHKKYHSHFEVGYYIQESRNEEFAKEINLYTELILPYISLEQNKTLLESLTKLNKVHSHRYKNFFEDSFNELQDNYKKLIEREIKLDAENIKYLYNKESSINDSLEQIYLKEKSCNKIEALPTSIKKIVDNVTKSYIALKSNTDNLSSEENFQVKNLMEKRVPEILNLYLKFDQKYRNSMKTDDGQTIEDLTISSLKDIDKVFDNISKQSNERLLNNAAALKRYTHKL